MSNPFTEIKRPVRIWLFIGLVMVFFQVVIGGVTRLTDSGLSITEWAVIQGTLPPANEIEWQAAFEEYKVAAKKQFESLHADMSLSEFKVIYFWEYFHRLWARLMAFVFLIPFLFFLWKKWLPRWLVKNLAIVILLASLAAVFGIIMVLSGLHEDNRTWVSAYKLVGHLSIATALFGYLFWTWLKASQPQAIDDKFPALRKLSRNIVLVILLQIVFGGLMAGMRAGLIHPHFPFFIEGGRLLNALSATAEANVEGMMNYETGIFAKGIVQIFHRATAYVLCIMIVVFFFKARKLNISKKLHFGNNLLIGVLVLQFLLGVLTIINCIGGVPILFGAVHQAGALILLLVALFVYYQLRTSSPNNL